MLNHKALIFCILLILAVSASCNSSYRQEESTRDAEQLQGQVTGSPEANTNKQILTVFAAASLTGAFQEIAGQFEVANPGVQVRFNFAGSQILRTQLEQGSSADVFASADHNNMDILIADQLIGGENVHNFVTNSLIVILPELNPGYVETLADLARPHLKLILADSSVPAGNYARQILAKMSLDPQYGSDFAARVLANIVSNETDVKQVVTKVELGEADAGMVYASDAVATPDLRTISIPTSFNVTASYPIAVISNSSQPALAQAFVSFVTSPAGQTILTSWGFTPAGT